MMQLSLPNKNQFSTIKSRSYPSANLSPYIYKLLQKLEDKESINHTQKKNEEKIITVSINNENYMTIRRGNHIVKQ